MKVAILVLCLVAAAIAAPETEKRFILDTFTDEGSKIAQCELKLNRGACEACCNETNWLISAEVKACTTACSILPQ